MISVEGVTVGYGAPLLSGITFSLSAGSLLLLLGPNGSGKTTLMRTLLGALPVLAGQVHYDGVDLADLSAPDLARRVAFVPQEESAPFEFTSREMVSMGRIARSGWWAESPQDRDVVERAMQEQNCLDLADRKITELSGGEAQRVRLARAAAQEAPIWILDEPNSHLDIRYQLELEDALRRAVSEGKAVLASVHDLAMAERLDAPVLLLADGQVRGPDLLQDLVARGELGRAYGVSIEIESSGGLRVVRG